MPTTTTTLLAAALLAAPLTAHLTAQQIPAEGATDWRMPFRSPQANLVPPDAWEHLRPMYEIARDAPADRRRFVAGVEVVDDPVWARHRDALTGMSIDVGHVSLVLRESQHVADRAVAFYGAFLLPDPRSVFALIEHIPGEPARALREAAYARAAEYARVHLPTRVPGDLDTWRNTPVGPAGERPPRPGDPAYGFDPAPFVALLAVDDWRDHEQALWFLARCAEALPELGQRAWSLGAERIRTLLRTGRPKVLAAVRDFVAAVAPTGDGADADRAAPAVDAGAEAWLAWHDTAFDTVFPPVRRVSEGLYDLHPHAVRDELVRVGRELLGDGSLGTANANGTTAGGTPYRGYRIEQLPEPLDRLGLSVGDVITAIDGHPVPTADRMFRVLDSSLRPRRQVVVEFVDRQRNVRAIRYRIH